MKFKYVVCVLGWVVRDHDKKFDWVTTDKVCCLSLVLTVFMPLGRLIPVVGVG